MKIRVVAPLNPVNSGCLGTALTLYMPECPLRITDPHLLLLYHITKDFTSKWVPSNLEICNSGKIRFLLQEWEFHHHHSAGVPARLPLHWGDPPLSHEVTGCCVNHRIPDPLRLEKLSQPTTLA